MPPLLTIALLTLREATRRRVLAFLGLASFAAIALSTWGFVKLNASATQPQAVIAVESVLVVLLAFAFSVVLAIAAAFLASPAIAGEVESGVALAILPRPLSRTEYVLGKWLGLALLLAGFTFVVGGLEFVAIGIAAGYRPPHPLGALAYLSAEGVALLTLALLASTRLPAIAGGIAAVAAFGASWIAGIVSAIAGALHNDGVQQGATAIGLLFPTDGLWRGAAFELQPVALLLAQEANENVRAQNPFATTAPPAGAFLAWTLCWMLALLAGACYSFTRRDI
jgi:ABC-type transport system involved in multi-copper enzyme maturation permease subunit